MKQFVDDRVLIRIALRLRLAAAHRDEPSKAAGRFGVELANGANQVGVLQPAVEGHAGPSIATRFNFQQEGRDLAVLEQAIVVAAAPKQ